MTNAVYLSAAEIVKQKEFQEFLQVAKHFCALIESYQSDDEREFMILIQNDLLVLYSLGRNIPNVHLSLNSDMDITFTDIDIEELLHFIVNRIPFTYYWAILNPLENGNPETGTGDLMDDLGDTYKDLKEAILLLEKEDLGAKENALFKFRFGYQHHWGEHCIDALNVIHQYLQHGM